MNFSKEIIAWYELNKRVLPWRGIRDPYSIWLSEVILQQTRVEQGLPYYTKFLERFPTVKHLANAKEQEVLRLWQGLGYYSRARNLHAASRQIMKDFGGKFPSTINEIRQLKGVGDYTAAAIASFAFGLPEAVVDGNVFRLLSRFFGISTLVDSSAGKKEFFALAKKLLGKNDPGIFNQAMMEFGSKQCRPHNPLCENCPLSSSCFAFKHKMQDSFPVKKKKKMPLARFFHYMVIRNEKGFYLNKREGNDIWKNMYEFPLIESTKLLSETDIQKTKEWKQMFAGAKIVRKKKQVDVRHILSHRVLHARFFEVQYGKGFQGKKTKLISFSGIQKLPLSRLMTRYFEGK